MAQLPSGAVTFLFTDIEGSTRLVKQLRDRYPAVLADHQRLLRGAFSAHGGHEVDTQGDSFFVAFANAREALLAAVDGQLALTSHAWPEGADVKVRMGLHTGQAVASEGRYTGLASMRPARSRGTGQDATGEEAPDPRADFETTLRIGVNPLVARAPTARVRRAWAEPHSSQKDR